MKKILIILVLSISTLLASSQTTYYVAASGGNNGNIGTTVSPWATLAYAVTVVSSGDTIYMQPGSHIINSTVILPIGIHLRGADTTSIITTTTAYSLSTPLISMISSSAVNGNQTISYLKFDGNVLNASMGLKIRYRHNVKIYNCTFVDIMHSAVYWYGDSNTDTTPPATYMTGCEFHDNTVRNCSAFTTAGYGALAFGGMEGMLIYNNYIHCGGRTEGTNGLPIKLWVLYGWAKDLKVHDNILIKGDASKWDFSIEANHIVGGEFYNNTCVGSIDLNYISKGSDDYGAWIHDNLLGPEIPSGDYSYKGLYFEYPTSDVIVERNIIRNVFAGMSFTPRSGNVVKNYRISYNLVYGVQASGYFMVTNSDYSSFRNINVENNVFYGTPLWGIALFGTWNNLNFVNNIVQGATYRWLGMRSTTVAADSIYLKNNITYSNGNTNTPYFALTATNYTNSNNLTTSPLFTTAGSDFTLQSSSPAIDAGIDVGLTTDYRNYAVPYNSVVDIGAYEYGSSPATVDQSAHNILTFVLASQTSVAVIDTTNHTVNIEVAYGTVLTALQPTITLDYGATVSPASGVAIDFTSAVTYVVTALDSSTQDWTITITIAEPPIVEPTVTTSEVSSITSTTAISGGDVTEAGGASVTARGICWATTTNPTVSSSHTTDGTGIGVFISSLTSLSTNTLYYYRAYAINSIGTTYGTEYSFTTQAVSTGNVAVILSPSGHPYIINGNIITL